MTRQNDADLCASPEGASMGEYSVRSRRPSQRQGIIDPTNPRGEPTAAIVLGSRTWSLPIKRRCEGAKDYSLARYQPCRSLHSGKIRSVATYHSILKFFQVDITGMFRMTSPARYFKDEVDSVVPIGAESCAFWNGQRQIPHARLG